MRKSARIEKEILKSYASKESWKKFRAALRDVEKARTLEDYAARMALVPELEERRVDPSLRDQLRQANNATAAYLDACRKAPDASSGTKRKWRKVLGL